MASARAVRHEVEIRSDLRAAERAEDRRSQLVPYRAPRISTSSPFQSRSHCRDPHFFTSIAWTTIIESAAAMPRQRQTAREGGTAAAPRVKRKASVLADAPSSPSDESSSVPLSRRRVSPDVTDLLGDVRAALTKMLTALESSKRKTTQMAKTITSLSQKSDEQAKQLMSLVSEMAKKR